VGPELLGKLLVRRYGEELLIGRVVETEVYLSTPTSKLVGAPEGALDRAAHAFAGKTPRNAVLFGPPGVAYVYFIYGNHYCLNVSCMREGEAGSVLFRALEPIAGVATMAKLRGLEPGAGDKPANLRLLCGGPGRLTQAMAITRQRHNGMSLTSGHSELFLTSDDFRPEHITQTARVGITKSTELPLRYLVSGSPFVSRS
jgi:DNA-3-methyladenine glycosylase